MSWIYKGKPLTKRRIPKDAEGFVYVIFDKCDQDRFYVGKKVLKNYKKKRLTKKEKLLPENKRKKFKIEVTESDWQTYYGSSDILKEQLDLKGEDCFRREILRFCNSRAEMTYWETKYQFCMGVLENYSYNGHIMNKFFKSRNGLYIPDEV